MYVALAAAALARIAAAVAVDAAALAAAALAAAALAQVTVAAAQVAATAAAIGATPSPKPPCATPIDFALVLDESGSMKSFMEGPDELKAFAKELVRHAAMEPR